jgi:RNA polymerase sigma factor (sigma-70 family)
MGEQWIAPLVSADPEAGWGLFIERYRRLILGAIRDYTVEHDEVMDVFARVCEALREHDFARLRHYIARADPARPFSTWLVAVVHNLTIDWFRHRDGRPRLSARAAGLPPLQRRIFEYVFLEQRSHIEAYELLCTREGAGLSFGEFLKELGATYRAATDGRTGRLVGALGAPPPPDPEITNADPAVLAERQQILVGALDTLSDEDRLAVQLYVVEEMPAEQVARVLGYRNTKTAYNHIYRALAAIRANLAKVGIRGADL